GAYGPAAGQVDDRKVLGIVQTLYAARVCQVASLVVERPGIGIRPVAAVRRLAERGIQLLAMPVGVERLQPAIGARHRFSWRCRARRPAGQGLAEGLLRRSSGHARILIE